MSYFKKLSSISSSFESSAEPPSSAWKGSPFEWIMLIPSRSKGAYGEKLVQELFRSKGFDVKRPQSGSDHDRVINGHRVEIKMSTLWTNKGIYKFQQIRDQEYDYLVFLGLSPKEAHCWVIPKSEFKLERDGVSHQHGGKKGTDTLWIEFDPSTPPKWLKGYGGTLEKAVELMGQKGLGSHTGRNLYARDKVS